MTPMSSAGILLALISVVTAQVFGTPAQPTTCYTKSTTTHGHHCPSQTTCSPPECTLLSTIHLSCGCSTIGTATTYTKCKSTCTETCVTSYQTIYSPCPTSPSPSTPEPTITLTIPVTDPTPTIITSGVTRSSITFDDTAPTPSAKRQLRNAQVLGEPSRSVIWGRDAKAQGLGDPARSITWDREAAPTPPAELGAREAQGLGDPSRSIIWNREAKAQGLGEPSRSIIWNRAAAPENIAREAQQLGDPSRTVENPPIITETPILDAREPQILGWPSRSDFTPPVETRGPVTYRQLDPTFGFPSGFDTSFTIPPVETRTAVIGRDGRAR